MTEGGMLCVMTPMRPRPHKASIQMQMTAIPGSRPTGFAGCGADICGSVIFDVGLRLQRMQIGQQIVELLLIHTIAKGRHHVASAQNHRRDAIIVCGRAAG
jgi:hypothetical protein